MRPYRRLLNGLPVILLWWLPATAPAHQPSDSYLTLDVTQRPVTLQWDIALRDLDYLLGMDHNGDGALTWGEVRAQHPAIAAAARAHLQLTARGRPCPWVVEDQRLAKHSAGAYARVQARIACAAPPDRLAYSLLFDTDPTHRGILRVITNAGEQAAVLAPHRATWSAAVGQASSAQTFAGFWVEGVWHIWLGLDHVLFLLTLLLSTSLLRSDPLSASPLGGGAVLRRTCAIVTGFTLGHSATLGLAAFGVLQLPATLVEPAIAATLVLAAVNNLYRILPGPTWLIAGVLGLFHGLGFAAVLDAIGLPLEARLTALLGFNLGVESGQLAIVLIALPLIGLLRDARYFHRAVVPAASWLVVAIGLFWLIERSAPALGSGS